MPEPYTDITFALVAWNEEVRLPGLLAHVRPWFEHVAVAVQRSADDTLRIAEEWADIIVTDEHRGFGDATFGPLLLPRVPTLWTLKLDADEWPTENLLQRLGEIRDYAVAQGARGVWIPFRSWVDDAEWPVDHAHLRLFHTALGWPGTLHSRPNTPGIPTPSHEAYGFIEHKRSLEEMLADYLRYSRIGKGHPSWDAHNHEMLREATKGAASRRGWGWVQRQGWWPQVRDVAFEGKEPVMPVYCAGPSGSGTRMLFDMVNALGETAVHASLPGYGDLPDGKLDVEHPVWWSVDEWQERYGEGRWIIIERDPKFAAQSAIKRGFVPSARAYAALRRKALGILEKAPAPYMLDYAELVADPQGEYDKLADWLGVPRKPVGVIHDANAKYRQGAPG